MLVRNRGTLLGTCVIVAVFISATSKGTIFGQDSAKDPAGNSNAKSETKDESTTAEKNNSTAEEKQTAAKTSEDSDTAKPSDTEKSTTKPDRTKSETESTKTAESESEKKALQNSEPKQDTVAEFDSLAKKRIQLAQELQQFKEEFAIANNERKKEIYTQMQMRIVDFNTNVYPRMRELAADVYKAKPDSIEAGEFTMMELIEKNQYQKSIDIGTKLLNQKGVSVAVTTMLANAYIAIQQFEEATKLLEQSREKEPLSLKASRLLILSKDYQNYWKKEQELQQQEAAAKAEDLNPLVILKTSKGDIELELFENQAPNTVANFISLIEAKTYDGVRFHRVDPNFVIQTGDETTKTWDPATVYQEGSSDFTIKCECNRPDARKHFRGSLSMAHVGKDTGSTKFLITHRPTPQLNVNPHFGTGHTVFGRVVKGMEIVDQIAKGDLLKQAIVQRKRGHEYKAERTPVPKAPSAPDFPPTTNDTKANDAKKSEEKSKEKSEENSKASSQSDAKEQPQTTEAKDSEKPKESSSLPDSTSDNKGKNPL